MTAPPPIRNAQLSDVESLAALWHAGWQDAHARIVPAELARHRTLDSFRQRMRDHIEDVRVIGEASKPSGFSMLKGDELNQFYVAAEVRGTGIAAILLRDAEDALRQRGVRDAWLACAIGNERAARFYEKQGWRYVGIATIEVEITDGLFAMEVRRHEKQL